MPFKFERLAIPDLILVSPRVFSDGRGIFLELYKRTDFAAFGITADFVQDNFSKSSKGVVRGLHYQLPPKAQGKLVKAVQGAIWDVAVDLRKDSPTYLKYAGAELNSENQNLLYIPPGFAHGFCVLSESACVMYKCTNEYAPDLEKGVRWDDPELGIKWPAAAPLVSERDSRLPHLKNAILFP